jgi:hypothetical protein
MQRRDHTYSVGRVDVGHGFGVVVGRKERTYWGCWYSPYGPVRRWRCMSSGDSLIFGSSGVRPAILSWCPGAHDILAYWSALAWFGLGWVGLDWVCWDGTFGDGVGERMFCT